MAADSTAMTIDFLRARLLSERSVSRAAKERADELANRVAELEEQLREVTAQRRQAERATTEVLAILESQGFGGRLLSDADDDDEDEDARSRGDTVRAPGEEEEEEAAREAAEDALSGTHAQPGGLSWKGRSVSPRKVRQLKQKHRRSYFYLLSSSDSSPKYRMGQSCRKNKRQMVMMSNAGRSVSQGEDAVAAEGRKARHDGSDCSYDGQDDMDGGEAGGDERSSGDGGGGAQYVVRYEKDGEMERVLERQAELIEQYEEEEKAQREWEKQYNQNRNADKATAEVEHKPCQNREGREDSNPCASQAAPCDGKAPPTGSLSESPQNISQENGAQLRRVNDRPGQSCAQTASVSAQENSSPSSAVTRQDEEISDGDSCFNGDTTRRSPRHCAVKTPSEGSPSSDTRSSKVSDWSSSQFHDHTDSQQSYHRPVSSGNRVDIGSVLEALQLARISLSAKLRSKPVPPSQVTLALPAPGDDLIKERDGDLPGDDGSSSSYREERGSSSPARQEILALPAPEDYHEGRVDLPVNDTAGSSVRGKPSSSSPPREEILLALPAPGDDYHREIDECMKIPAPAPGLFRLPTDSFPADQRMFASSGYVICGSGYGLGAAATRLASGSFSSNPSAHCSAATEAPSTSGDGSGLSAQQYYDLYSSVLAAGTCNSIARPDLSVRERDTPFLSGVPGLGDADFFMQRGIDYTISNKWML